MENNKKVFVMASALLFSGLLLESNIQTVQATTATDSDTAKQVTDNESTVEGENVTTTDDGIVSADVTYDGVKYSVKGKTGTTVKATPTDGSGTNSINVSIMDRKISEFSDSSTASIKLGGASDFRYQIFDDFGQPIDGEYEIASQSLPVSQVMNNNGNLYYRISEGKWIEKSHYNEVSDNPDDSTFKDVPYFAINKMNSDDVEYDYSQEDRGILNSDGTVQGTITKYSYVYKKNFDYSFHGTLGQTVIGELKNPDNQKYNLKPVKIKIGRNEVSGNLPANSVVSLNGGEYYKVYLNNGSKSGMELSGPYQFSATQIRTDADGNVFYKTMDDFWIKQGEGVALNQDFDNSPSPYIEIVKDKVITADVVINSNLGNKKAIGETGEVGDDLIVTVPTVSGYKADKSTVSAHVNGDGTITTKDSVKYTPIKSNFNSSNNSNSSSSSNTDTVEPEYLKQTVSTFPDKPNVKLYHLNADTMKADDTRALAPNSDWQSDQRVVVKGETYYRVATNEWVKASQVYIYTAHPIVVETKPNGIKKLASAEGNTVTDRALASDTDWYSDRIAYLNDGTTEYYRVATNEFVKQSDINEITK